MMKKNRILIYYRKQNRDIKKFFLCGIALLAFPLSLFASNYDFSAVSPSGHRLYYKKLTPLSEHKVSVTYPGSSSSPNQNYSGFTRPTGALEIPATITSGSTTYTVTEIGTSSFYGCTGLTSVSLPSTIVSIRGSAFRDCIGLTNIVLPNSVKELTGYVFDGCTNLVDITLSASLTKMQIYPAPGLGASTLCSGCISLQNIYVAPGNTRFKSVNGILYTINGDTLVRYPINKSSSYHDYSGDLLSYLANQSGNTIKVLSIGALSGNRFIERIVADNGIECVGPGAFQNIPNLQSVVFGSSVLKIDQQCCSYNSQLAEIVIGSGVAELGDDLFYRDSSLTRVVMKPWSPPAGNGHLSSSLVSAVNPTIVVPCGRLSAYSNYATIYTRRVEEQVYEVKRIYSSHGNVSVLQEPTCANNRTIKLKATPASGYHFKYWKIESVQNGVDNSHTNTILTYRLTTDINVQAVFIQNGSPTGIDQGGTNNLTVTSVNKNIVITGTNDEKIQVIDLQGRVIFSGKLNGNTIYVPFSGVYIVKIGETHVQKVVVM